MKPLSGTVGFAGRRATPARVICLALILGAAMFTTGCGKKGAEPAAGATATQPAGQGDATTNTTNAAPDLRKLNHAMMQYVARNHHKPANIEEFAAKSGIEIPPPPPGKKYAMNSRGFIVLVDSSKP
jgi:hypothetical protein